MTEQPKRKPPAMTAMYYLGRPTHYQHRPPFSTPACGKGAVDFTTEAQDVSCGLCHRTKVWRAAWAKWKETNR